MTDDFDDLDVEDLDDLDAEEEEKATKKKAAKKSVPKGIGASAVAVKLEVEPKTFRAWLRTNVANGKVSVKGHDFKGRYSWASWKDPELVAIIAAWKEASHERGGKGRKKAEGDEKPAAKPKATSKTAPKRKAKTS